MSATEEILAHAQKLVEEFGIAPRDAIHCASALSRVRTIISDDSDLDVVSGIKRDSSGAFKPRG